MTLNKKGFDITFDTVRHILLISVWGLWDQGFAKRYDNAIRERIETISTDGKSWHALIDATEFRPQSEEVLRIMTEHIAFAREQGMKKVGYLRKRSVTQLLFNELFQENEMQKYAFFETADEAL